MAQLVELTDQIGQTKLNTVPHGLLAQLVGQSALFNQLATQKLNKVAWLSW